jgi:hypothetical protein
MSQIISRVYLFGKIKSNRFEVLPFGYCSGVAGRSKIIITLRALCFLFQDVLKSYRTFKSLLTFKK